MEGDFALIILMYHSIIDDQSPVPVKRESGAELYDVKASAFRLQLECIKASKVDVTITFDDGEMNNYQTAYPLLKEFGFKGYFFVIVNRVGQPGYMGWNELKELIQAGMCVGSHGLSHEILTNLLDSQVEQELKASKSTLEANLGITIDELSIPRGFCNDKIIQMAHAAGYKKVYISQKSYHIKEECLPRVAVKGNWSIKRLQQALAGKTPILEQIGDFMKKLLKTLLREEGYNALRKILIYLNK